MDPSRSNAIHYVIFFRALMPRTGFLVVSLSEARCTRHHPGETWSEAWQEIPDHIAKSE